MTFMADTDVRGNLVREGTATFDGDDIRRAAAELSPRLDGLRERIARWREGSEFSFLSLPASVDPDAIMARARPIADRSARTIVFGIGGSSLGGEMLVRVLGRGTHRIDFYDNIDPLALAVLDEVDWRATQLLVISKSGDTPETLAQFLAVLPRLQAQIGDAWREHCLLVTGASGALSELGRRLSLEVLPHPDVGGRYSVLSVVGLLPAAVAGVDIAGVIAGARAMAERVATPAFEANPAFMGGAVQYLHAQQGRTLSVMVHYGDRLFPMVQWFRQLWGESLGKRDSQGRSLGLTPVRARGVTDQHSQLQLYLDGPDDKQFTLLAYQNLSGHGQTIPTDHRDIAAVAPLAGHRLGELFEAELAATRETLVRRGRPVRTLRFAPGDAVALGEFIVLLEMETVVVAALLGVDPFDQPAVEEGKILAREYLSAGR